ncbi:hypothetical protein [Natrarchaeobius chitinivorans]|uniref:Uncharacterized protein n=1 Tax=Natrarchaeobius chitinivorans TaxID=1679083 RepID=A0A3N6P5I0_NATCH|nr:hypothetical protein [Natrarchaeobius chitinivorans]RQG93389.1 hypothetical protein EA473_15280 [Natrarchaeobius chitinivorans]
MTRENVGDTRWGWCCPHCNRDVDVVKDPSTDTFRWECPGEACRAVGFGFSSRRQARIALLSYRKRYENTYR